MLVVGLTGSIGSGKSTVADLFADHGVPVIDADIIARDLTEVNTPAFHQIVAHFGKQIVDSNGNLNRSELRNIIFSKPDERRWLETLLHPAIMQNMLEAVEKLQTPYCLVVIPLLLETDAATFIQRILVVDIPESTQLERASLRDNTTIAHIKAIIKTQASREYRLHEADDVIDNTGTLDDLSKQVDKLHQRYLKLGKK
tara:strand:+ start:1086 stop:1682 length:597 start_codon:yes stop_codon:yes gene_type:complete